MFKLRSGRFYVFIVGYTAIFAALAFFGAEQMTSSRMKHLHMKKETEERIAAKTGNKELYALPQLDLTMIAIEGVAHHVRLGINLEMDKNSIERFESFEPRVSGQLVDFLGHEAIDRFQGPNGITKLKRDILPQINRASKPILVSDVIFREFVVR